MVLTSGRTGSELLRSLMGSHPLVYADVEILDRPVRLPRLWVTSRRARYPDRAYGFKVKIQDIARFQGLDPAPHLRWLDRSGYRIIHLRRENVVLQALSVLRARATGEYHRTDEVASAGLRALDCGELLASCRHQLDQVATERAALEGLDRLELVYEDDLDVDERHQATCDRIFDHLGLERVPVATGLRRTRPRSVTEEIANLDEVLAALAGAGLAHHLDEGHASS